MKNQEPLVSIFMMCKNSAYTIRRSIESVLAQDYPNIEYIVQDGASTDGTLEILKEYGDRIKLISEPDSGSDDGFFRALKRCTGDIIGSCLSDEELLPYAVSWAVNNLSKHPDVAAIYGDYYRIDFDGKILSTNKAKPFNFERYLCHEIVPPFCSSFFRRTCLEAIGYKTIDWALGCGEFELWIRLGVKFPIRYVSGLVAKFGVNPRTNSQQISTYLWTIRGRIKLMDKLFNDPEVLQKFHSLKERAFVGLHLWAALSFIGIGAISEAKDMVKKVFHYQPDPEKIRYSYFYTSIISKLYNYGIQLVENGSPSEALDYLNLAPTCNLNFLNVNYARAIAFAKLNKLKEAIAAAKAELAIHPEHIGAKQILQKLSKDTPKMTVHNDMMTYNKFMNIFCDWILKLAYDQNRLYYRDQTPESLKYLLELVYLYQPIKIVELGTLSGLSLRTWLLADSQLNIVAIDFSFKALHQSQQILSLDLSRVKLIEQDILKINFSQLGIAKDKVLFYVDAHDQSGVPIMNHILNNIIPLLPKRSLVVVDDLWYSDTILSDDNAYRFFEKKVINEIDSLQCFEGYFAPYWKGGSFFGFREVIPLMEWINQNKVELIFDESVKLAAFESTSQHRFVPEFDIKKFLKLTGKLKYNPVEEIVIYGDENSPVIQHAFKLCGKGIRKYATGNLHEAMNCFQIASNLNISMAGIFYAQAIIFARLGQFEAATELLYKELKSKYYHLNAQTLLIDILAWMKNKIIGRDKL
ncbi:putative Glycosyltransferase [Candidatus Magnetomoraceae bacterium gMMP-1]